MKTAPPNPRKPRHIRVPAFVPAQLRARTDGWTPLRQAQFLVALARSRSVRSAAAAAGMSRVAAYRLRRREGAESFAATWDAVLGSTAKRKVTPGERTARAYGGLVKPLVLGGRCVGLARKVDNSALLALLAQLDRGFGAAL